MKDTYTIEIAGLQRTLPVCKISDDLSIAAFVIFGDVEMTVAAADALLKRAPAHDILITAEAKGIPLVHEMARQSGNGRYVIARKATKLYMRDVFSVEARSITTPREQRLFIDGTDAALMRGKNVLIIDDVISTGDSLRAVEKLVKTAGGNIAGKMAALAEGDAKFRDDIVTLAYLPLLDGEGNPKE
jgi:adenine phosphoribosyltransferase